MFALQINVDNVLIGNVLDNEIKILDKSLKSVKWIFKILFYFLNNSLKGILYLKIIF